MRTGLIGRSKLRFDVMATLGLLCTAGVGFGCSSSTNSQPSPSGGATQSSTGGNSASGGGGGASSASATGGTTDHATGGASAAGGTTDHATGGASAAGGTTDHATGGASAAGGTTDHATGGASAAGGSASGGVSVAGGSASGGASAPGGSATGGGNAAGSRTGGSASGGAGGSAGAAGGSGTQGGATSAGGSSAAGSSGTTSCAARVLSLSSNATGSAADTADSHVEADLKTDLPIGNALRTIEFWAFIKTTDWVGDKNEIFYYGTTGSAGSLGMDFGTYPVTGSTTNHATLDPFTGGAFNDDSKLDLGITSASDQWVHIAMVWDGTSLLTYVNGALKLTSKSTMSGVTALATGQSVLSIGCNPTNNPPACFNGYLAEFRVWNVARAAADILANYKKSAVGNETGLVAYYKFDDAAGATTATDSVTAAGHSAHTGTLKADTTAHNPTFITPATALPLVCP